MTKKTAKPIKNAKKLSSVKPLTRTAVLSKRAPLTRIFNTRLEA